MTHEVKAPALGESVSEIIVGQWQKSEGEPVEEDEVLVELESEKATLDLPAPTSGVLKKIVRQQGDSAEVGETLAIIDDSQTPGESSKDEEPAPERAKSVRDQRVESPPANQPPKPEPERGRADAEGDDQRADAERHEPPQPAKKPAPARPVEHEARRRQPERAKAPPKREEFERESTPRTRQLETSGVQRRPATSSDKAPSEEARADVDRVPMSPVRRRIAERLVSAQHQAALLTTFNEVDMTAVKQLRAKHGEAFAERHGVRLGFMSFFVKAAVAALQEFPEVNAAIDDDQIVYHRYHHIGVAVSTPKGLVVPTLKHADAMSLAEIEATIADLAGRAREGRLRVEELQGGTFTITNGGIFGSLLSTPLVNPPQSAVLGMHAIQERPVAVDGQVAIQPMMYLALTYDHRLVDGEQAVKFLKRIAQDVADPLRLWLGL